MRRECSGCRWSCLDGAVTIRDMLYLYPIPLDDVISLLCVFGFELLFIGHNALIILFHDLLQMILIMALDDHLLVFALL